MKLLTKAGYIAGLFVIAVSTVRWLLIYDDQSQAMMGILCGLIILGGSWLHHIIMNVCKKQEMIEGSINAINKFYIKEEWKE